MKKKKAKTWRYTRVCLNCGHRGRDVQKINASPMGQFKGEKIPLCSFCSRTHAGNVIQDESYSDEVRMVANLVAELYWMLKKGKCSE